MKWLSRLWPGRAPANTARRSPRQQTAVRRNTSLGSGHLQYASSPLLAAKTPLWRARLVVLGVGVGFLVLLGRAVYIQVIGTEFYQKQGESRYARTFELPASRGRITDRHGQILAASVPAPSIWAIPKDFRPDAKQQQALLRLLGMTSRELATRLADNPNFVWLRRQVDESVAAQVKALGIKGLHQQREFRRQYPEGESAAHVVGFTNLEERGQEGIELAFQKELEGRAGSRSVVRDRLGRIVEDIGESREPVDGSDLALALDSKVQFFAYQRVRDAVLEHNAKAGSVVVLDVLTGEVLALANYPSYVPGERQGLSGAQLRNRAVTDTFEPGSTMKPFIAALALQTGRVTPDTVIQTAPGRIHFGSATISDSHPHGLLSVEQATMSYGYGLSVSLLQLARAYTVFARDGQLMPVTMLKNEVPAAGVQVFSPEVARSVRHMLNMAAAPGGTAPKAQAIGYSVGGKTGTAHKQEGGSYVSNKYRAWFVGIAPVSNPRIVVAVMVDEPGNGRYFGGDVAAPVFSQVVQQSLRMLGVPPDLEVQPQIVARAQAVKAEEESF